MRSIKTTSGTDIILDGDLLAVLEALFHEVTARKELERSYEDMNREINHLIGQLTDDERKAYLAESLFLMSRGTSSSTASRAVAKLTSLRAGNRANALCQPVLNWRAALTSGQDFSSGCPGRAFSA